MADYLPHTSDDVASMLDFLGMNSLDDLFAHIPGFLVMGLCTAVAVASFGLIRTSKVPAGEEPALAAIPA